MRGLPRILSLIRDKLNKFNNTGAVMMMTVRFYLLYDLQTFIAYSPF